MTAIINPTHAKFWPEVLPEALTITAATSGANIATYGLFSPYAIIFNSLFTDVGEDVILRLDKDSSYGTLESEGNCRSDREETKLEIPCISSLNLWALGANTEIAYTAYTMKITKPTIFEKVKYGIAMTPDEQALDGQYGISKNYAAGLLEKLDAPITFRQTVEVVEKVTVAAGGNTTVGPIINVQTGQKAVILSFGTDESAAPAVRDTFISVTRGISETGYVKLDTAAMPGLNHDVNCYIPSVDRFEVLLESVTGVSNMQVRYKYAISDITIIEKIRWGIGLTSSESAIATELDLYNLAITGIM